MAVSVLTCGLAFGDEGKGATVDALTRQYGAQLVVRYNGGAQCAHHVVTKDGRSHCFAQFGSGTFAGAATYLSQFVLIDPIAIDNEAQGLQRVGISNPYALLFVHPDAPLITPYHQVINRLRELSRGPQRHGSCGVGIGALAQDLATGERVVRVGTLLNTQDAFEAMGSMRRRFMAEARLLTLPFAIEPWFDAIDDVRWLMRARDILLRAHVVPTMPLLSARSVIFEGAQGALLDETHGFHPYNTWTNLTFQNAETILQQAGWTGEVERVGVIRTFFTRHGAGPFPTEVPQLDVLDGEHNSYGQWQGSFRVGRFDYVLLRYALRVMGRLDSIALTCVDRWRRVDRWHLRAATAYRLDCSTYEPPYLDSASVDERRAVTGRLFQVQPVYEHIADVEDLVGGIEAMTGVPVGSVSSGPTAADRTARLQSAF